MACSLGGVGGGGGGGTPFIIYILGSCICMDLKSAVFRHFKKKMSSRKTIEGTGRSTKFLSISTDKILELTRAS